MKCAHCTDTIQLWEAAHQVQPGAEEYFHIECLWGQNTCKTLPPLQEKPHAIGNTRNVASASAR